MLNCDLWPWIYGFIVSFILLLCWIVILIIAVVKSADTRNPPETRRVRVQKCTRGSTCGRILPSPAGLPAGGFLPNPHPHPRVPSLSVGTMAFSDWRSVGVSGLWYSVKKMNKWLKEINSIGYIVFLKDEPHHQLMKVEKKFKKNKQKKEKKPKHESFAIFGEWVSGGEESSASSSDESNRNSPPTWDHHPTLSLWPKIWIAM